MSGVKAPILITKNGRGRGEESRLNDQKYNVLRIDKSELMNSINFRFQLCQCKKMGN